MDSKVLSISSKENLVTSKTSSGISFRFISSCFRCAVITIFIAPKFLLFLKKPKFIYNQLTCLNSYSLQLIFHLLPDRIKKVSFFEDYQYQNIYP
jgi:hypothetical protein